MRMRIKWRYYAVTRVMGVTRQTVKPLGFTGDDAHKNGRKEGK